MFRVSLLSIYLVSIGCQTVVADQQRFADSALYALAHSYLDIPYRTDGVTDILGRYVTFTNPAQVLAEPGFNCSGFVVDFARKALGNPLLLDVVTVDRDNDSGPGAPWGEDWDFGRDLILNVTEGRVREFVGPLGEPGADGLPALGFNLHDKGIWRSVLPQLETGKIYFASLSKPWYAKKPYRLIHYHVAVILKESANHVWLYHATRRSRVHRYNLASDQGMALFDYQFPRSMFGNKHILLVGVAP